MHGASYLDAEIVIVVEKVAQRLQLLGAGAASLGPLNVRAATQVQHCGRHAEVELVTALLGFLVVLLLAVRVAW
jgi:hypothetical protein